MAWTQTCLSARNAYKKQEDNDQDVTVQTLVKNNIVPIAYTMQQTIVKDTAKSTAKKFNL